MEKYFKKIIIKLCTCEIVIVLACIRAWITALTKRLSQERGSYAVFQVCAFVG